MADTSNMGMGNPFLGKDNPYLQSIIDMTSKDMTDAYGRTALPAFNAGMIKSGSFGNSGIDEMTRAGADQLQGNIGDAASKLRFNDYATQQQMYQWQKNLDQNQSQFDDQFGRSLFNDGYAQNMGNLQVGMGLLGTLGQYNSADAATAQTNYDAPLSYLTRFTGLANGIAGNGGSTSSTTGTTSSPVATALGGAQLGSKFADWWSSNGSGSGNSGSSSSGGWWA